MSFDQTLYRAHLGELANHWSRSLVEEEFDAAVVPASQVALRFQDDMGPPFVPNPHFAHWFPSDDCEGSVLLLRPGVRPKLFFLATATYWHKPPTLPEWADGAFDVAPHNDAKALRAAVANELEALGRAAVIGPEAAWTRDLPRALANPESLTNKLFFFRAAKTPFEIECIREATAIGVRGHLAARDAFLDGGSEFDIHMAYLAASSQEEAKLPYPSIIALNEHAGLLHYQHYQRARPAGTRSFLIDAGGKHAGYHSDITRTYSANAGDSFDGLVRALDEQQLALCDAVRPGVSYIELQERMHLAVGAVLVATGIIRCSPESAYEREITDVFVPHGLGHLIGLQTHDVGGRLAHENGETAPPPARFPTLRYTRSIEENHVITVEPGIYFIPMLLDELKQKPAAAEVNWKMVEDLAPCGGVRIEDDVLVNSTGVENLTRSAFQAAEPCA